MTKQKYENKKTISICGILDKDEMGNYIVSVEGKDNFEQYNLNEILDSSCGEIISFVSETYL